MASVAELDACRAYAYAAKLCAVVPGFREALKDASGSGTAAATATATAAPHAEEANFLPASAATDRCLRLLQAAPSGRGLVVDILSSSNLIIITGRYRWSGDPPLTVPRSG